MGAKWQRFDVVLPKTIKSYKDKLAVGEHIIEYIRQRTEGNKNNAGKRFPNYSKAYEKSLDFKIAGKSQSDPNLKLTGDMLADLEVLSITGNKLLIGYKNGTESNAKADGHQTGWQGERPNAARPFLGFESEGEKSKLKSIIREHERAIEADDTSLRAYAYISAKDVKRKIKSKVNVRNESSDLIIDEEE